MRLKRHSDYYVALAILVVAATVARVELVAIGSSLIEESNTTHSRTLRGDQIEVFKILNCFENIATNICFLEIKESKITRGHNFTLVKKQSRLYVRKFSFSKRTIIVWNKLSTECVHASSVNMFKKRIGPYTSYTYNTGRLHLE